MVIFNLKVEFFFFILLENKSFQDPLEILFKNPALDFDKFLILFENYMDLYKMK